jgi:hypothetical protein
MLPYTPTVTVHVRRGRVQNASRSFEISFDSLVEME